MPTNENPKNLGTMTQGILVIMASLNNNNIFSIAKLLKNPFPAEQRLQLSYYTGYLFAEKSSCPAMPLPWFEC